MRSLLSSFLLCSFILLCTSSCLQKHKSRVSPPAVATQKVGSTTVTVHYSQPSVKGRTIGVNLEPFPDSIWRAGANETTVFEVDKDVLLEGKTLPKGKYGFFLLQKGRSWILIFSKTWDQWGTKYNEADDIFRVPVRGSKAPVFAETLNYKISPDGIVTISWGEKEINFVVQEKKS